MYEDISGLHIPVDDVESMQVIKSLTNLEKHLDNRLQSFIHLLLLIAAIVMVATWLLVAILWIALFQHVTQVATIAVLGYYVDEFMCLGIGYW